MSINTLLNKTSYLFVALVYWVVSHAALFDITNTGQYLFVFLDVGQGDSMLIKTPEGKSLLVDLGPDISVLAGIEKYLENNRLDYVFVSHGDEDHIGGIYDLNARYEIGAIIASGELPYPGVFSAMSIKKAPGYFGCCLQIIPLNHSSLTSDSNSNSKAYLFKLGDFKLLTAGDLPAEQELEIAHEAGDINILKVGHHGSKTSTSSEFLGIVKPELAVVSVGSENRYGHPHLETLTLLKEQKVAIARTDRQGTIIIKSDGKNWSKLSEPGLLW